MERRWVVDTPLYNQPSYNFEVNLGHRCNMRCKFCFEQGSGYTNMAASKEDLSYFAGYMRYTKERTRLPVTATIYGGEPFVHLDTLVPFVQELSGFASGVSIVTNGLNTRTFEPEIDAMKAAMGSNTLKLSVSYNFSLQDETRQSGTYEHVRDSIRWLCSKGYFINSPVVFTPDNVHRIGEVFDDFLALFRETGGRNMFTYNYFVGDQPYSVVQEDVLREECARIRRVIDSHEAGLDHQFFRYSMIGQRRGDHRKDCMFAAVLAALGPDGCIYPGYDVVHDSDYVKNLLRFGHVGDPYSMIDIARRRIMRMLGVDPPLQCRDCHSQCRVIPWRTLKDDVSQYNQMPNPDRCKVVRIIGEYLPVSGVSNG